MRKRHSVIEGTLANAYSTYWFQGHVSLASCFNQILLQGHCGFKLLLKREDPPMNLLADVHSESNHYIET
jgi:hypothetical protein